MVFRLSLICFLIISSYYQTFSQVWLDHSLTDSTNLYDAVFADSLRGFAVGDSGLLITTVDGGVSWQKIESQAGKETQLIRIQLVDSVTLVILGRYADLRPFFLVSEDAGIRWELNDSFESDVILTDIRFIGKSNAYVCGMSGFVAYSGDFLRSWSRLVDPGSFLPNLKIAVSPQNILWVLGGKIDQIGYARASSDEGVSWTERIHAIEPLRDIQFVNQDTLFAIGGDPEYGGWIYFSSDTGKTWVMQAVPEISKSLQSGDFSEPKDAWVTGAGVILHSTNMGGYWHLVRNTTETVYRCTRSSKTTVWFCGSRGYLWEYRDTGTGSPIDKIPGNSKQFNLNAVVWPNPTNGGAKFSYFLDKKEFVEIRLYNILGSCTKTLFSDLQEQGENTISIPSDSYTSGCYFIRISCGSKEAIKKLIILK